MATCVIPTSDRPDTLPHCLTSVVTGLSPDSPFSRVIVVDDSRSPDSVTANRATVDRISGDASVSVIHVDNQAKQRLVETIHNLKPEIPRQILAFAIMGDPAFDAVRGGGCNRNTAMLMSAGERVLSIDDDARFRFSRLRTKSAGGTKSGVLPGEMYVSGAVHTHRGLRRLSDPVTADVANDMLSVLEETNATAHGPERVRLAMMQAPERTVTDQPFLVTSCYAADARELLAPFPPAARTDDTIFASLMKRLYPEGRIAHLPVMVHHDLGPQRPDSVAGPAGLDADFSTITAEVIRDVVMQAPRNPGAAGLSTTAERLAEISALSHHDWIEYTHAIWLRSLGGSVVHLERLLDYYNEEPAYWARDVHAFIRRLKEYPPTETEAIPQELRRNGQSPEEACELHRSFFRAYGELIAWWPEIWSAAATIRESEKDQMR
ncbi:MAG: glycosyltransferase family A protein [Spirochaeta sp.]|jgi:glycosyltransferase involved in cell wall biosynthesis|nr:glycosyltransferase family A protein [Spirochaeta sp.]